MKTLIGVNVLESVNSFVYSNHIKFFASLKQKNPDDQFLFFTPYRMSIDRMRNIAAQKAIETGCDYLMFIDDDVLIKPETYEELKKADKDIIMALTYIRGYPFKPMFFKTVDHRDIDGQKLEYMATFDDYEKYIDKDGIVNCAAVGFSCVLIKVDLIKAVAPPWFVTGPNHTEDVYFCNKARFTLDPDPTICCHTKLATQHIMMSDAVTDFNVEKLRELYAPEQSIGRSRAERIENQIKFLSEGVSNET